ncbi:MAG: hypothetical protein ABW321_06060 [Polyangiales bacterium]
MQRGAAWFWGAALLVLYLCLPEGDESLPDPLLSAAAEYDTPRLEITSVTPREAAAGSAVVVTYGGTSDPTPARVVAGKTELRVLARREGAVVVELPQQQRDERLKLRVLVGDERSKAHELRVKSVDWRKPFRNLCGGFVLLMLGVGWLASAARKLSGSSTRRWTKTGPWQLVAVAVGGVLGGLMHSATATAGILAGAVGSRVVALRPAAALFLGAQLGAAATPFLLASASEPHEGLIAVAIGGLCLRLASDRQGRALAWLMLSGGIVAFALQVLRPGFEPIVSNPTLLRVFSHFATHGMLGAVALVALGALLVVLFQGPAPVLVLALAVGHMLGQSEPRVTLLLLSGSSLGAALGALLTTPFGTEGRRLAQLNMLTGLCGTLLTAASIGLFDTLAQRFAGEGWPIQFGRHVLPAGAFRVAVAFALSQLSVTLVLLGLLPYLERLLDRLQPARVAPLDQSSAGLRSELAVALNHQARAIPALLRLAVDGERPAGREAATALNESDHALRRLFGHRDTDLDWVADGGGPHTRVLAALQLQRALERALKQAERLTDERLAWSEAGSGIVPLVQADACALRELHGLLGDGVSSLHDNLTTGTMPDIDEICAREIQINALESQLRVSLSVRAVSHHDLSRGLSIITLVDVLETAGNQLYRLADACSEPEQEDPTVPAVATSLTAATPGGPC